MGVYMMILYPANADSADDDQVVPDLIKATKKLFKPKAKAKRRKVLLSKLAKPRPPKKAWRISKTAKLFVKRP